MERRPHLDSLDKALSDGIERGQKTYIVTGRLEWKTVNGRKLSPGPQRWYRLAIRYLDEGRPAVAGRFLWLARLERLREVRA